HHNRARDIEALRASWMAGRVTVDSPEALEQNVHRREIGEEDVRVEVETLLHSLGRDDDYPTMGRRALAEATLDSLIEPLAILPTKTRVVQRCHIGDTKEQRAIRRISELFERALRGDGAGHRIAKDEHARSGARSVERTRGDAARVIGERLERNMDR